MSFVVLLIAFLFVCRSSFADLHALWTDWLQTTYCHGYLIVALCAWLLWRQRSRLRGAALSAEKRAAAFLALGGLAFAWLFSRQSGLQALEFLVLPPFFWAVIRAGIGRKAARAAAFPAAYFYFATSLAGAANGFFQWTTVFAVRSLLRLAGLPAYFIANRVEIPEGSFEIEGGCSGLHFAIVGAATAVLLGELRRDRLLTRASLLLLAVAVAMVANWVRVVVIIVAGHLTHMQHYLVAKSHYSFGWAVFAVAMVVFFALERRLPAGASSSQPSAETPANRVHGFRLHRPAILALALLAGAASWLFLAARTDPGATLARWPREAHSPPSAWRPRFESVDAEQRVAFHAAGVGLVDAYQGLYRNQYQGKEFTGYGNELLAGVTLVEPLAVPGYQGVVYRVQDRVAGPGVIAATYEVGSRRFASPLRAQVSYALQSLLAVRSPPSRITALHADCQPDCASAAQALVSLPAEGLNP